MVRNQNWFLEFHHVGVSNTGLTLIFGFENHFMVILVSAEMNKPRRLSLYFRNSSLDWKIFWLHNEASSLNFARA